ncbi:MAG TPA: DUF2147 domain-containing protein [Tenuifilaceae bacterium]|nr:DUF2147 domain-containing protein [Tenuifilaceae bacterium]
MKKMFSVAFMMLVATAIFAQDSNKVLGVWLTQDGDSKVTITKDSKGKFNGEITWLKDPLNESGKPKVDDKNPEKKLQSRPIMGLKLLEGFVFDKDDKEWVDGKIYDPKTGKTYSCLMWFDDDPNKLSVKGFIGFSLIGREVVWTRDK